MRARLGWAGDGVILFLLGVSRPAQDASIQIGLNPTIHLGTMTTFDGFLVALAIFALGLGFGVLFAAVQWLEALAVCCCWHRHLHTTSGGSCGYDTWTFAVQCALTIVLGGRVLARWDPQTLAVYS